MPPSVSTGAQPIQSGPGSNNGVTPASGPPSGVQLARDLIAGRVEPHTIPYPQAVEDSLKRHLPGREPPRWLRDNFNLQAHYGGRAVA